MVARAVCARAKEEEGRCQGGRAAAAAIAEGLLEWRGWLDTGVLWRRN